MGSGAGGQIFVGGPLSLDFAHFPVLIIIKVGVPVRFCQLSQFEMPLIS